MASTRYGIPTVWLSLVSGCVAQDRPDLAEHGPLLLRRQRGDVADAADPVDDVVVRADVDVREGRLDPR